MVKLKKAFRIIKNPEAQLIDGEWIEVYMAQYKHMGRWFDVKKPDVYTSDSPTSAQTYTEVRHMPALFRSVAEAKAYCTRLFNPVEGKNERWDVVSEFTI